MRGFSRLLASSGPSSALGERLTPNLCSAARWQAGYANQALKLPLGDWNVMFSGVMLRERS